MASHRLAPTRQGLSPIRHDEGRVRIFALGVGPGFLSPPQPRGWGQLVTTRTGALTLRSAGRAVTITPEFCAWVPDGTPFALEFRTRCDLRIVLVHGEAARTVPSGPRRTTPLLREAVERAVELGYLDPAIERHARIARLIEDELAELAEAPAALALGLPHDAALRASIEPCLDAGDDLPTIAALAAAAHVSLRTFERRLRSETGLSPREWLRRARLAHATIAIAGGANVTEAGLAAGYSSLSAFIAAYRASYGTTPGRIAR